MSSFIGHSLAGLTTYAIAQQFQADRSNQSNQLDWKWLLWLLVIASSPDIDYLIPALRVQQVDQTLRITHSLLGVLLLPGCTILGLWLLGNRGKGYKLQSLQVVLVGLSHLLLDLLTGVFPLPLLYPLSTQVFKLPFGLLPSAGRIQLSNYLLYRNLLIELGVLLPLSMSLLLSVRDSARSPKGLLIVAAGLVVSICFMVWAFTLDR
ncbi:MAG TPA: metal-dependent hydrolase [Leptolyngbyaceae cyanobacterium M33_DOE_097]|uniref:Metal-dependent hydrolase n=1 Tax=Oscillatoriales cyanobacterium SpSt-418 TaxID=2282169 RepID=A0A7C3PIP7_9CYAN|nr:metal-dependent hydrolase [Leptolyngbyaceae cyanobacterium M33_DOE_097]